MTRYLLTIFALLSGLLIAGGPAHASVILSNSTTSVSVEGGDAGNGLIPYDGYFRYTDLATAEETTWSIDPVLIAPTGAVSVLSDGLLSSPVSSSGGALSSASVGGVSVTAFTELVGTNARTTFEFSSTTDMGGTTFLFHAENDIFGFADDVATFSGSIAGGDLELFMFDSLAISGGSPGLSVIMSGEAGVGSALSLFGAGIWTGFGTAQEAGDLSVLSADGSNFVFGPADLGVTLGFDLFGTSSSLVVNYLTVPEVPTFDVPEPTTLLLLGLGLAGLGFARKRHH